jgi:site-specific DNA-methyltransferase (cytosine-N4-specific)
MPESVKDRPIDAYEHILMLTKSARYYWDMEAVREQANYPNEGKWSQTDNKNYQNNQGMAARKLHEFVNSESRNLRNVWTFPTQPYPEAHFATYPEELPERCIKAATKENDIVLDPFTGSGTTMKVAAELNRRAVGYEISEEYCKLTVERNKQSVLC